MTRILTVGLLITTIAAATRAEFDGPAPLAWRFVQPTPVAGAQPLVNGNTIYQALGGRVFCIDKETGNLLWRFPQVDPIEGAFRATPLLGADTLVVAGDNKLVYGVNPNNGQLKWSYPTSQPVYGQPAIVGQTVVFATSDNKIHSVNLADGTAFWATPYSVPDGINGTMIGVGNSVVLFNNRAQLFSIDLSTRKTNWTRNFTQLPPNPVPVAYGESIFAVSGPYVISVNPQNGVPRWQISTGGQLQLPPAVSDSGIYVVSQDGKLYAYDHNRTPINRTPISLGTLASQRPTAVGKLVVVTTTAGGVMLVDPTKMPAPTARTTTASQPGQLTVDPSAQSILWNYLIRPLNESAAKATTSANSGGGTGPGGSGPGGAGFGGGGGGGGQQQEARILTIQANAPAVVAGDTLLIAAKDGSLLAFDKNLGVDLTPPSVKMVFPNPGDQVSGQPPLLLAFRLQDDASGIDIKTIKVEIEGQAYDSTFNKDGLLIVRFSLSSNNRPLSDGRKSIIVTAVDWMGNTAKQSFALTIDNTLKPIVLPGSENNNNQGGPGRGGGGGLGGDGR
ncbi:MAG TPA: PQQ-binding-like beta-propeller repeat protein [Fimbriimonas sp.]|nr:PQQ-binding-like beta-propeller repeat protein [Fimbriimonas sp.]